MRLKQGYCIVCGNDRLQEVINGRCRRHYWECIRKAAKIKKSTSAIPKKRQKYAAYRLLKQRYFKKYPTCQFPGCNSRQLSLHHKKGRTGDLLCRIEYFCGLCLEHHQWVEAHPFEAQKMNLSLKRLE